MRSRGDASPPLRPPRWWAAVVGLLVDAGAVLRVVNPLLSQRILNNALVRPYGLNLGLLLVLVLFMIAVALVSGMRGVIQAIQTKALGQLVLLPLCEQCARYLECVDH